ncbi:hypothetical protein B0T24DRAFT_414418 [Lasiosphaeria ovina]|uniref:Uncharacterized protein n=1 Tax=Lasiosphaeria ovina TaxID=92902 RepID=A0AAE0JXC7_9PEZI|nr:hypothetical protein B0T24DRAFT_414418 [Lasiosphaeria ovina]
MSSMVCLFVAPSILDSRSTMNVQSDAVGASPPYFSGEPFLTRARTCACGKYHVHAVLGGRELRSLIGIVGWTNTVDPWRPTGHWRVGLHLFTYAPKHSVPIKNIGNLVKVRCASVKMEGNIFAFCPCDGCVCVVCYNNTNARNARRGACRANLVLLPTGWRRALESGHPCRQCETPPCRTWHATDRDGTVGFCCRRLFSVQQRTTPSECTTTMRGAARRQTDLNPTLLPSARH